LLADQTPSSLLKRTLCSLGKLVQSPRQHQIVPMYRQICGRLRSPDPKNRPGRPKTNLRCRLVGDLRIAQRHRNHKSQSNTNRVAPGHQILLRMCNRRAGEPLLGWSLRICWCHLAPPVARFGHPMRILRMEPRYQLFLVRRAKTGCTKPRAFHR